MSINNCVIEGRLTADVELRHTQSDVAVCNFCVAVDRQIKKDEEKITDWIDCVAWRSTAEFISKYFHKGDPIAIVGKVQTRNWEDQNGNKRKSVELLVDNVSFTLSKSSGNANAQKEIDANIVEEESESSKDDLPF